MTASPAPTLLSSEAQFYLPAAKGLKSAFASAKQLRYADRCVDGHIVLANQFLEMLSKSDEELEARGADVSLTEQLYRNAARIRRATALELEHPEEKSLFLKYGQPLYFHPEFFLAEEVVRTPSTERVNTSHERYKEFYPIALEQFKKLRALSKQKNQTQWFGPHHTLKEEFNPDEPGSVSLSVYNNQLPAALANQPVAKIAYSEQQEKIVVAHAPVKLRKALFKIADAPLKRLIQNAREHQRKPWDAESRKRMWEDLAELSLHLYHNPPLQFGSQTATLMIIAGIAKACGLSPAPGNLKTDHFLDAEIIPYAEYIRDYHKNFGKQFTEIGHQTMHEALPVDTAWIETAHQKFATFFFQHDTGKERLESYAGMIIDGLSSITNPGRMQSLSVKDGRISCKITEPQLQEAFDAVLDFVGHQDVIAMLGLSPEEKVSTAEVVWEKAVTGRSKGVGVRQP